MGACRPPPRGDRDLYIRSVGDRDLYVRKNNYTCWRVEPVARSKVTGYRVMGVHCRATLASWDRCCRICRSNPSIHQRLLLLRGLVIFFTAWQGAAEQALGLSCDLWLLETRWKCLALHTGCGNNNNGKKRAVVSGVEPACPWTLPRRQWAVIIIIM